MLCNELILKSSRNSRVSQPACGQRMRPAFRAGRITFFNGPISRILFRFCPPEAAAEPRIPSRRDALPILLGALDLPAACGRQNWRQSSIWSRCCHRTQAALRAPLLLPKLNAKVALGTALHGGKDLFVALPPCGGHVPRIAEPSAFRLWRHCRHLCPRERRALPATLLRAYNFVMCSAVFGLSSEHITFLCARRLSGPFQKKYTLPTASSLEPSEP